MVLFEEWKTNKPKALYISYGETDEWLMLDFIVLFRCSTSSGCLIKEIWKTTSIQDKRL
jgi:hypothetical protein